MEPEKNPLPININGSDLHRDQKQRERKMAKKPALETTRTSRDMKRKVLQKVGKRYG
jgi:hypothetical protein